MQRVYGAIVHSLQREKRQCTILVNNESFGDLIVPLGCARALLPRNPLEIVDSAGELCAAPRQHKLIPINTVRDSKSSIRYNQHAVSSRVDSPPGIPTVATGLFFLPHPLWREKAAPLHVRPKGLILPALGVGESSNAHISVLSIVSPRLAASGCLHVPIRWTAGDSAAARVAEVERHSLAWQTRRVDIFRLY